MSAMDSSESFFDLYEEQDLLGRAKEKVEDAEKRHNIAAETGSQDESGEEFDSFSHLNDPISEFLEARFEALDQDPTILEQLEQDFDSSLERGEGAAFGVSSIEPAAGETQDTSTSGFDSTNHSFLGDSINSLGASFTNLPSYNERLAGHYGDGHAEQRDTRLEDLRHSRSGSSQDIHQPDLAQVIFQNANNIHDHGPIFAGAGAGGSGSSAPLATPQDMADWLVSGYWGGTRYTLEDMNVRYKFANRFNADHRAGLTDALDLWGEISGFTFTEVSSGPDLKFNEDKTGAAYSDFFRTSQGSDPDETIVRRARIYIDKDVPEWSDLHTIGKYGLHTAIHEIGHAFGLGHAGPYNGTADYATDAIWSNDSRQFTVMSYFDASNTGADHVDAGSILQYASTPLLFDIYAMQQKYGANYSTRAGDTIYGFNSNAGRDQFDFSITSAPVVAIWDGGGIDTIDLSGYTMDQIVYLEEGHFSDVGGLTNNLSIAYGVVIENAIGGSGNDTLYGNDAANILTGGAGHDTLHGGAGNDALYGGGGDDVLISDAGNDYIDGGAGNDTAQFTSAMDVYTGIMSGLDLVLSLGASVVATVTDTVEGFIFNGVAYNAADVITYVTNNPPVLTVNDLALNDGQSVLAATIISATDAEGAALVYTIRDTNVDAGSAFLQLDGVVLAANTDHSFTQAELDRLEIHGGVATSTDELQVNVSDGVRNSGVQNLDVDTTNTAPVRTMMTDPFYTMDYGTSMLLSDLISYADGAQDSMTYSVRVDEINSHYLELDGVQLTGLGSHALTDAEYARLRIVAPNENNHQDISVIATDGEHTDTEQTVQVRARDLNTKPDIDISGDINITVGSSTLARDHIDISDADGDALMVEIVDNAHIAADEGYIELDGAVLSEGQSHNLTFDEFNRLEFFSGTTNGRTTFNIRVDDGYGFTRAQQAKLVSSITNTAPMINVDPSVSVFQGDAILASSVINVSDADGVRDTLTYQFQDLSSNGAYLELSGAALSSGQGHSLTQAEFDQLNIVADSQYAVDSITMRVSDGHEWTDWADFNVRSESRAANVTTAPAIVNQGDSVLVSSLVNAIDPEGDTLTYFLTDKLAGGSSFLRLDGIRQSDYRAHEFTADEFSRLEIIGGTKSIANQYSVRVFDGYSYSDIETFDVTSVQAAQLNNAPSWGLSNITTVLGTVTKVSDVLSINDADGDTLSYSVFDDNYRGDDAYLRLDGLELAARTYHSLTQAEFDRLEVVTDGVGSERFRIYATDGEDNTGVQSFYTKVFSGTYRIDAGSRSGAVVGEDSDNWLRGSNGQEKFFSRGGADDIHGYGGADDFVFEAAHAFSGVDTLHDFDAGTGDRLDISDILSGFYDDQTDVLTDFVQITDDGTDSTLSVDQDGGGDNFVAVATIKNATGLTDENQLVTDGNLIV